MTHYKVLTKDHQIIYICCDHITYKALKFEKHEYKTIRFFRDHKEIINIPANMISSISDDPFMGSGKVIYDYNFFKMPNDMVSMTLA